jgi:hypothetical protein
MAGEVTWEYYDTTYPHERVAVARRLCKMLEEYGLQRGIAWKLVKYETYFAFQVDHSHSGRGKDWTGVCLFKRKHIEYTVKFARPPKKRMVENLYPNLKLEWHDRTSQWQWEIPNLRAVPDVAPALDVSDWR